MPAFTYLSDSEVRQWSRVEGDKDCDELLQELRRLSGENWIIGRQTIPVCHASLWKMIFCKPPEPYVSWTLYADCHGEWQVINLVTPEGGSNFHASAQGREDIMNFMLGYIAGLHRRREATAPLQGNAESPSSSDLNATGAITRPPE